MGVVMEVVVVEAMSVVRGVVVVVMVVLDVVMDIVMIRELVVVVEFTWSWRY